MPCSPCSPSSATSAARAASPPGRTSSPCGRRGRRGGAAPGTGREIPLEAEAWNAFAETGVSAGRGAEDSELFAAPREEIESALSERQREVLVAVTLNDVPIDVLAERLGSSRGALYKVLHDARRKLREALAARVFSVATQREEEP
jgi:DNA-directed RNA polymerase specialized sigma24 family protein